LGLEKTLTPKEENLKILGRIKGLKPGRTPIQGGSNNSRATIMEWVKTPCENSLKTSCKWEPWNVNLKTGKGLTPYFLEERPFGPQFRKRKEASFLIIMPPNFLLQILGKTSKIIQ